MFKRYNADEKHICDIANSIDKVDARLSKEEEDCGYQKADVVLNYNGKEYYLQVSHTPKSKKQIKKLSKRGTHPIATHRFEDEPFSKGYLVNKIKNLIE